MWRKSSQSLANGDCVELATPWYTDRVLVRDSRDHYGIVILRFTPDVWRDFIQEIKNETALPRMR